MKAFLGGSIMSDLIKKYAINGLCDADLPFELLTPKEMGQADQLAVISRGYESYHLMLNAAQAVGNVILEKYNNSQRVAVICGPGNNGGDGYAVAEFLKARGYQAICFSCGQPRIGSDAHKAFADWSGTTLNIDALVFSEFDLIVDALYGAGLGRGLDEKTEALVKKINASGTPVVAIDLPSGIFGRDGSVHTIAVKATYTVTFFRLKPGHVCYPARAYCGDIILRDIGIMSDVLKDICPNTSVNLPKMWLHDWPVLDYDMHKYSKGHVVVFSGPAIMTGAARLAAYAAARSGAGLVTILSPQDALSVHESHLTSVMLKEMGSDANVLSFFQQRKVKTAVLGPGFGAMDRAFTLIKTILAKQDCLETIVLDADALTAIADKTDEIFELIKQSTVKVVLTPHEGEFRRIFPKIASKSNSPRIDKAREAALKSGATVVYKGADSMIASPDGRLSITVNGTPFLATAGSGDVLSGIMGGLLVQGMPVYEAVCAGNWMHAECGRQAGIGAIADDLITQIPSILQNLICG